MKSVFTRSILWFGEIQHKQSFHQAARERPAHRLQHCLHAQGVVHSMGLVTVFAARTRITCPGHLRYAWAASPRPSTFRLVST